MNEISRLRLGRAGLLVPWQEGPSEAKARSILPGGLKMNEEGKISPGRRRRALRLAIAALLAAALVASGILISGVVLASHNFSDVPTTAFYHAAVEWVFNRGITAGCAAGLYCPDAAVTRGQMAVFLRALGNVLTPSGNYGDQGFGAIDIDTGVGPGPGQLVCMTPGFAAASYPRTAVLLARVSIFGPPLGYTMATLVSTNGGATWAYTDFFVYSIASPSNDYAHTNYSVDFPMNTGTTYNFAIEVGRATGTADPLSGVCNLQVAIFNRTTTTSPLAPAPLITPQQKGRP